MTAMQVSLMAGSLVGGAMFTSAAMVTAMTGNLSDGTSRRVTETGLMVGQLSVEGSLRPGGPARRTFARVRLLHAGLRHHLPASGIYTRTDEVAVNQHDLAITLALFGYVNVRSLGMMGVRLTDREVRGYLHMWNLCGFLLGIEDALLPADLADQRDFFMASCVREAHPELVPPEAKALLTAVARDVNRDTWGLVSVGAVETFLCQAVRFLAGNEYSVGLRIPDLGRDHWSVRAVRGVGWVVDVLAHRVPFGAWFLRRVHGANLARLVREHERKTGALLGTGVSVQPDVAARLGAIAAMQPAVCPVVAQRARL